LIIIFGGGLLIWGEIYLNRIKPKFKELARDMIFGKIEIVESVGKCDSGLIGAAALLPE
jgi:hypothetical protein